MQPNEANRTVSIFPELTAILLLALLCLTPLLTSSGVELVDWLVYHNGPAPTLFELEPLVGVDAWLHWGARLLILAGVVNVIIRRALPYASHVKALRRSSWSPPRAGTALHELAVEVGCSDRVRVLEGAAGPVAFTSGLFRPRIHLSESIVDDLGKDSVRLVVLHEMQHCRSFDPLRTFVATLVGDLFFWVPASRGLVARVTLKIEYAADQAVGEKARVRLAQTILDVAELTSRRWVPGVTAFSDPGMIRYRVRRLIGTGSGLPAPSKTSLKLTAAVLIGLWGLGLMAFGTHNAHLDDERDVVVLPAGG